MCESGCRNSQGIPTEAAGTPGCSCVDCGDVVRQRRSRREILACDGVSRLEVVVGLARKDAATKRLFLELVPVICADKRSSD